MLTLVRARIPNETTEPVRNKYTHKHTHMQRDRETTTATGLAKLN